ncbi:hypothetical protein C1H46_029346 [Malus baccata]|uniref:Uncharacterized protein n=1 Tax=Malus baccata TaxID=106549 RepID=A0A540LFJ8_MALBA|nr:hypothetical protein C1H46_029346 [Malus baccata]
MAQRAEKEETKFKVPETLTHCVNNCGIIVFYGEKSEIYLILQLRGPSRDLTEDDGVRDREIERIAE